MKTNCQAFFLVLTVILLFRPLASVSQTDYEFWFAAPAVTYHPVKNKIVIVPVHANKDLPKGTFNNILKQAGIDKSDIG